MNYEDNVANWHRIFKLLYQIPPSYEGPLSEDITKLKAVYHDSRKELKNKIDSYEAGMSAEMKETPSVGMSASEVRESTWGDPYEINTTETKYGTNEQWVYAIDQYIYLEDGIVTSIQY